MVTSVSKCVMDLLCMPYFKILVLKVNTTCKIKLISFKSSQNIILEELCHM